MEGRQFQANIKSLFNHLSLVQWTNVKYKSKNSFMILELGVYCIVKMKYVLNISLPTRTTIAPLTSLHSSKWLYHKIWDLLSNVFFKRKSKCKKVDCRHAIMKLFLCKMKKEPKFFRCYMKKDRWTFCCGKQFQYNLW